MAISLFDVSVASFRQTVGAMITVLDRGRTFCQETEIDPDSLVETRLAPDMLPFSFQIRSVVHHSIGAVEACKAGLSGPPSNPVLPGYAGLQTMLANTAEALAAVTPDEINGLEGKDVVFELPNFKIPFTAETYMMSFALPNLHFHATTAYDILRLKGAPLSKRDYLGALRIKA